MMIITYCEVCIVDNINAGMRFCLECQHQHQHHHDSRPPPYSADDHQQDLSYQAKISHHR